MPNTILRPYFISFKNRLSRSTHAQHNLKRDIMLLGVSLIIMLSIFLVFVMIFINIRSNPVFLSIIPVKIIQLLFYAFFIVLVVSNTVASIGAIYSAKNMEFLLYTPVSSLRLYFAKVLEMLAESSFMLIVFSFPTALAFYYSLDVSPRMFLDLALLSPLFLLTPIGFAILFGTLFVNFSAYFWKRGSFFIFLLAFMIVFAFYKASQFLSGLNFKGGGVSALLEITDLFSNPNPIWLPSRWASEIITVHFQNIPTNLQSYWSLLAVTAFGSIALGYIVFETLALRVRARSGIHISKRAGSQDSARKMIERLVSIYPFSKQNKAIITKDLSMLLRDRAQSLQLILFLGVSTIYVFIFKVMTIALDLGGQSLQIWQVLLSSFNILFTGFIITAVMTRLVYPSVSLEGKAFWILITSPLQLKELILAKFLGWLPVSSLIACSLLLLGGLAVNLSISTLFGLFLIALSLAVACTGLAIGLGAIFASFEWDSPNQLSSGFGTLVLLGSSLTIVFLISAPGLVFSIFSVLPGLKTRLELREFKLLELAPCSLSVCLVF